MQKFRKTNKKGFTLTELAIVIAVIAVLIAVLVPTFISLINRAKESADSQLVKNMNTALSLDEAENGKPEYASEAIQALYDNGYAINNLTPTSDGCSIVYNQSANKVVLIGEDYSPVYPQSGIGSDDVVWVIATSQAVINSFDSSSFNFYGYCITTDEDITLNGTVANFDTGLVKDVNITIDAVTGGSKSVTGYTYTGADSGTVITGAFDMNSLHLYGCVKTIILSQGHVAVEEGGAVKDVIVSDLSDSKQYSVTGEGSADNIVVDKTSYSGNVDLNNGIGANLIYKTVEAEGYGTETSPYIAENATTLGSLLNSDYGNVTVTVSENGTTSTITATKSGDEVNIVSGAISESYYEALAEIVSFSGELRKLVCTDGSSKYVPLADAVVAAEVRIEEVYYQELSLIGDVTESGMTLGSAAKTSITLLEDFELTEYTFQIAENTIVSLDLNGHSITITNSSLNKYGFKLLTGSTFTISDSSESGDGVIYSNCKVANLIRIHGSNVTFNLNGGTLQQNIAGESEGTQTTVVYVGAENCTFNMNGGKIYCPNGITSSYGILYCGKSTSVINIADGKIINDETTVSGNTQRIANISNCTLEISGGEFSSVVGIRVYNAKVNISGGTINGTNYGIRCDSGATIAVTGGTISSIYLNHDTASATIGSSATLLSAVTGSISSIKSTDLGNGFTQYGVEITAANAAVSVTRDGTTTYYSSVSVVNQLLQNNDKIVLYKDTTSGISTDLQLTLDLNGHNMTTQGSSIVVREGGEVTLTSSTAATIKSTSASTSLFALIVNPGGKLTVGENITVTSANSTTAFVGESAESSEGVATLIVNGTIENTGSGYAISGNGLDKNGSTVIEIGENAVITSAGAVAIYHPQAGKLTVNGGTITGYGAGIQMCAGTLTISGGEVASTITAENLVNDSGFIDNKKDSNGNIKDGYIADGAAVSILNRYSAPNVNITGGTFTSASGNAIQIYSVSGKEVSEWTDYSSYVNISGDVTQNNAGV